LEEGSVNGGSGDKGPAGVMFFYKLTWSDSCDGDYVLLGHEREVSQEEFCDLALAAIRAVTPGRAKVVEDRIRANTTNKEAFDRRWRGIGLYDIWIDVVEYLVSNHGFEILPIAANFSCALSTERSDNPRERSEDIKGLYAPLVYVR